MYEWLHHNFCSPLNIEVPYTYTYKYAKRKKKMLHTPKYILRSRSSLIVMQDPKQDRAWEGEIMSLNLFWYRLFSLLLLCCDYGTSVPF